MWRCVAPPFDGWGSARDFGATGRLQALREAVCFPCSGPPVPPVEVLPQKATVLAPGSFEHVGSRRMRQSTISCWPRGSNNSTAEFAEKAPPPVGFFCFSAMPLGEGVSPPPEISDLLGRIDALHTHCGDVLLFRDRELYGMTALVNRYTKEPIRFVVGLSLLVRIWEYRYTQLPGSFLEALSRLLPQNVRIYAYPMTSKDLQQAVQSISTTRWQWTDTNGWVSARQLHPPPPLGHLYDYVLASNFLIPLEVPNTQGTHS